MPLDLTKVEYLGTNSDQTPSHEFCYYCLKDGEYTVDYSMQQMIDVWVKYTDKYNVYADTSYQPGELKEILCQRLPGLNRWKQKKETENIHFEIINRILIYINQHLFESIQPEQLAAMAGLSLFHFRRVFREISGENIGGYIQRLRLEYIAYKLISTASPVVDILGKTTVYNKSSLSKAFRKHFGISPSGYRQKYQLSGTPKTDFKEIIKPDIRKISDFRITCLKVGDSYTSQIKYKSLWNRLKAFAKEKELNADHSYISVSLDDPTVTDTHLCRFYLGVITPENTETSGSFATMHINGGLYAIFRLEGAHNRLPSVYRDIYLHWLPASGYIQSEPTTFEIYLNTPWQVPPSRLITDIYIPIEKKEIETL